MIRFEKNKFIDELTSFGVKAETYKYYKIDELSYLLTILRSNKLPIRILGGGSNILWTKKKSRRKKRRGNYTFEIRLVNGAKAKKWTV